MAQGPRLSSEASNTVQGCGAFQMRTLGLQLVGLLGEVEEGRPCWRRFIIGGGLGGLKEALGGHCMQL